MEHMDKLIRLLAQSESWMRFFYQHPEQYAAHKNKEAENVPANITWHRSNGTYIFSYALGTVIVTIGLLLLAGIRFPGAGIVGWLWPC